MDFVELPEHLGCTFSGTNSPVMLRVEAVSSDAGFMVEEFEDKPPHVTITGIPACARLLFLRTIDDLFQYLSTVERHTVIRSDDVYRMAPGWFLLHQRRQNTHVNLFATGDQYEFRVWGDWNREQIEADLNDACTRLKATYERFYDVTI